MAGVVTEMKGFSPVLILSKKKTNQHQSPHLDPQRLGQNHYIKEMVVMNKWSWKKWFALNKLSLNISKTNYVIFRQSHVKQNFK